MVVGSNAPAICVIGLGATVELTVCACDDPIPKIKKKKITGIVF